MSPPSSTMQTMANHSQRLKMSGTPPPRQNMSALKNAQMLGSPAYLSSLRTTKMLDIKPFLPAEILTMILEFLPVPDLLSFARTSRRMQEMVYDDTRWIQKLKSIGCWNEAEARQRIEETMRRKLESQKARETEEARRTGVSLPGSVNGIAGGGAAGGGGGGGGGVSNKAGVTLFDAGWEDHKPQRVVRRESHGTFNGLSGGFENISLAPNGHFPLPSKKPLDIENCVDVLKRVRSVRGHARQEFGRVYAALAPFYFDVARSRSHTDPLLFRVFRDPEQQAKMLAQVRIFARSDSTEGWLQREENLESMIAIFENAVLREFEQGYDAGDIDGRMRKYAHVLVSLNGGTAGVDLYIHNHRLMHEKETFGSPFDCLDSSTPGHIDLDASHEFFLHLSEALNGEASVIDRVFPPSVDVGIPFLERVAEEIITEYLTPLFDEAHVRSLELYLKIVAGVFSQSLRFIKSLTPARGSADSFHEKASQIINGCFEPHIDLYLQEELDFFKHKSDMEVLTWERQLSEQEASAESFFMSSINRSAVKRDFMASFKKVVMLPVNAVQTIPIGSPFAANKTSSANSPAPSRPDTPGGSTDTQHEHTISARVERPTTELAAKTAIMNSKLEGISSLFSIEVALNLVHAAKASIERAALFVNLGGQSGEEAKEQCQAIFVDLLQILGFRHIKPGFDKAVGHLSQYNAREVSEHGQSGVKPLVTFLELVNVGDLIQQMVDVFYVQELVATKLTDRDDFLDAAVKEKKRFEQMLDERVAAGLNKGIDVLMDEVEFVCATTQAAIDFNPGGSGEVEKGVFDIGISATAVQVVNLVSSHTSMLVGSADKNMLDVFNQEVGLRLFAAICKHLKRQRISTDGAIKLICDMNHYFSYIQSLKNKELLQYFKALRELSQIFLIDGKHAKEIAAIIADGDRYHGVFRAEEVLEYAERRADWYMIRSQVERAMYGMGCLIM